MAGNTQGAPRKEVPQYRLTAQAYIGERLLNEGDVIFYSKPPEWYMEPVNDAAREQVKKVRRDPIENLPVAPEAQQEEA